VLWRCPRGYPAARSQYDGYHAAYDGGYGCRRR